MLFDLYGSAVQDPCFEQRDGGADLRPRSARRQERILRDGVALERRIKDNAEAQRTLSDAGFGSRPPSPIYFSQGCETKALAGVHCVRM